MYKFQINVIVSVWHLKVCCLKISFVDSKVCSLLQLTRL